MVEIVEGFALRKLLLERYAKNPKNWSFTISPARKDNFFDALVTGPEEAWKIKVDSIFRPMPLMLGSKVELDSQSAPSLSPVSYGYRKLDAGIIMKLLRIAAEAEGAETQRGSEKTAGASSSSPIGVPRGSIRRRGRNRQLLDLSQILEGMEPVVPDIGASYAEGPFVFTTNQSPVNGLSGAQRDLDDKLSMELRRLLRNRYSGYG
jgi:hypothetical protein